MLRVRRKDEIYFLVLNSLLFGGIVILVDVDNIVVVDRGLWEYIGRYFILIWKWKG